MARLGLINGVLLFSRSITILSSRTHSCVMEDKNRPYMNKNDLCKELLDPRVSEFQKIFLFSYHVVVKFTFTMERAGLNSLTELDEEFVNKMKKDTLFDVICWSLLGNDFISSKSYSEDILSPFRRKNCMSRIHIYFKTLKIARYPSTGLSNLPK